MAATPSAMAATTTTTTTAAAAAAAAVCAVVAMAAASRGIGQGGQLPWRLPGDLAAFRRITSTTTTPATGPDDAASSERVPANGT